jgi:putative ABC transport system ATP-binding protein
MAAPRLLLTSVTRRLRSGDAELTILDQIDLGIAPGELVAIVGPSGSGKSTLLALLAGLDRPTTGTIELDDVAVHSLSEDGLAVLRRRIGFVFQSFQLLPHLTAEENVCLPMELAGTPRPRERARELLARVGLERRGHHYPVQLSGGEQQRVAIARAFGPGPELLLADEPTGNLDRDTGRQILALLEELHDTLGTTTVLVTHDPEVAARAERRIHLRDGRIERIEGRLA